MSSITFNNNAVSSQLRFACLLTYWFYRPFNGAKWPHSRLFGKFSCFSTFSLYRYHFFNYVNTYAMGILLLVQIIWMLHVYFLLFTSFKTWSYKIDSTKSNKNIVIVIRMIEKISLNVKNLNKKVIILLLIYTYITFSSYLSRYLP